MNFEERIDRLIERHEALDKSLELMRFEIQDLIILGQKSVEAQQAAATNIDRMIEASHQHAELIRNLAIIADNHERRLNRLES